MYCEPRIQEMPARIAASAVEPKRVAAKRLTILLVEDEGFVREVTRSVLESEGYRVLSTRTAAEARREFRRCADGVELLLTDVVLPDQNGLALANHLREICPELKTILMSGYPKNAVTQDTVQDQGWLYLHKPFSLESLMGKIKGAFSKGEGGNEHRESAQANP